MSFILIVLPNNYFFVFLLYAHFFMYILHVVLLRLEVGVNRIALPE